MEKKLTTNDMKSLLGNVIKTIDSWWVEKTNLKRGYFTRSNMGNSLVTYTDYVEWRYSTTEDSKNYASIFISLEYEDSTDYIRIALKTMKNGVYAEYDPFCEIYDGKTDVVFSEQTGFGPDNILRDVINTKDFDELVDKISDTVYKFVTQPDEEDVSVNMDDVSKTLSVNDIQDCMIKALRIMLIDRDTVNELLRLRSKYVTPDYLPTTQCANMLGYEINVSPKHVVARIIYDDTFVICSFTCVPDTCENHEFIIRYNSRDTGFKYEQGFIILYKDPESRCFEYTADGLNTEKIFKPFVNVLRNTLNYELYQQLPKTSGFEESKEEMMDTETNASAIKAGLMPKEVFVLDTSYFVIGDIYLLEIDPIYDWSKISTTPIKVPRQIYAICEDVCSTVIHFMLGGIAGRDQLLTMPVHADEIEDGLVTVKRVLMNESLIQNTDKECHHEGCYSRSPDDR